MRHPLKTFLATAALVAVAATLTRTKAAAPPSLTGVSRVTDGGVTTLEGAPPRTQDLEIARDRRHALLFTAPGRWAARMMLPTAASLRFALDVDPPETPVSIRLAV